jgi:hypothetical protein
MNIVFVYSKNGIIKVLDLDLDKVKNNTLLQEGWVHTATLDPCAYIEYLCNESSSIKYDVKKLLNPTKR